MSIGIIGIISIIGSFLMFFLYFFPYRFVCNLLFCETKRGYISIGTLFKTSFNTAYTATLPLVAPPIFASGRPAGILYRCQTSDTRGRYIQLLGGYEKLI